jgi:hypothetical protein
MASERGRASVEWVAAVLCVALVLGAAGAGLGNVDGRSYGGWLGHTIVCAVRGCDDGDDALVAAYGASDADLVRRLAPSIVYEPGTYTLPVDFRQCRDHHCSDAPDDPDLDALRSKRGVPATAFTHVVHRDGETFVQYWLYYPDSTSTVANAAGIWAAWDLAGPSRTSTYPGHHLDDWEGYQARVDRAGNVSVRATAHHGYQWCKQRRCANQWGPWTGWTRVSRGSHAGHIPTVTTGGRGGGAHVRPAIPGRDIHERTTTSAGLRLVPIEGIDTDAYGSLDHGIVPPWRKHVYDDPLSNSTS